ncbi:MAG: acylneuraminate cytidylyltransferase family protein [Nitrospina sp.]|jgi:CMP-N,N'-diacetyllegionaminic acid synthase|nr:acylneuraminate cytidylyltransferase family protein [Nitrospina sp.]
MALTVALIPARSGSKEVKNKNILKVNGFPLLAFSVRAALLSKEIDRVVVSTDSLQYKKLALEFGAEVPFLRPKTISGDKSNDYEFVNHALDWFSTEEGIIPSYIVQLRPTSPLRDPKLIDKAIREFKKSKRATALRSVHPMSESAYKCFHVKNKYLECICTRSSDLDSLNDPRQLFSKTYQGNGYVDVLKTTYIRKQKNLHGNKVMAFITPTITEVDTKEDFKYIEFQVFQNQHLVNRLF